MRRLRHPRALLVVLLASPAPLGLGCDRGFTGPGPTTAPPEARLDDDLTGMTPEELLERARMAFGPDEQIRIIEAAVAKDPENRQALMMLMQAAERRGMDLARQEGEREASKPLLDRAAEVARILLRQPEPLNGPQRQFAAMVFYNEACNFALDGHTNRAVEALRRAIDLGFNDPIIHEDSELDSIRDCDAFRELAARIPAGGASPADDAGTAAAESDDDPD